MTPSVNPREDGASGFISEDDLDTWGGFLRYHHIDLQTATPDVLAHYRQLFDQRAATPKIVMDLKKHQDESIYGVALREGSDLWLIAWVKRDRKRDVYVFIPRNDPDWNPHTSYHRDGRSHAKSFGRKMFVWKRQPLTDPFKGCVHLGMFAGHMPKSVGAICDPAMFAGVMEVPPGILGPRNGFVAVDLIEPGCEPHELLHPVTLTETFKDLVPWIVIRVGTEAPLK
jgi:hypothetical protein